MNYHILIDDKFIDDFIQDAELVSGSNVFILTFPNEGKFVKSDKGIHAPIGSEKLHTILNDIKETDKLFVHWFHNTINTIIEKVPRETKVYLMFWGGDFLDIPSKCGLPSLFGNFLYEPMTYKFAKRQNEAFRRSVIKDKLRKELKKFYTLKSILRILVMPYSYFTFQSKNFKFTMSQRVNFLKRCHSICHWNEFDIDVIRKMYNVDIGHQLFTYGIGSNKLPLRTIQPSAKKTITILLGNSDTLSNNHLDSIQVLSKFKSQNIKIYCPLNYKSNIEYAKYVKGLGEEIFGKEKFIALLDFIPRDEYYKMLETTDIAIMNHKRSQAAGNIAVLLRLGVKVYMNNESSIFTFLSKIGVKVFSSQEIETSNFEEFILPMENEIVLKNVDALDANLEGEEFRHRNLKTLLQANN